MNLQVQTTDLFDSYVYNGTEFKGVVVCFFF